MLCNERGIDPSSDLFLLKPTARTKKLFYYVLSCGNYKCITGYSVKNTESPDFLLLYIKQGQFEIITHGKTYIAGTESIVFLNCNEDFEYYASCYSEFLWVRFSGCNCKELYDHIISLQNNSVVFSFTRDDVIKEILYKFVQANKNEEPLTDAEYSFLIYKILFNLISSSTPHKLGKNEINPIAVAKKYIEENLAQDLSLAHISGIVSMSPFYFSRLFKKSTGYSPHKYIILTRMVTAKFLLKSTTITVKEIAFKVGYNNEGTFISAFTANVGVSPGKFRNIPYF